MAGNGGDSDDGSWVLWFWRQQFRDEWRLWFDGVLLGAFVEGCSIGVVAMGGGSVKLKMVMGVVFDCGISFRWPMDQ
ncbi:hypothetical protein V6N13_046957 [Hibiscus sabdariffa]